MLLKLIKKMQILMTEYAMKTIIVLELFLLSILGSGLGIAQTFFEALPQKV